MLYLKVADIPDSEIMEESTDSQAAIPDIEDMGRQSKRPTGLTISNKRKRVESRPDSQNDSQNSELSQNWRDVLGPPPSMGSTKVNVQILLAQV